MNNIITNDNDKCTEALAALKNVYDPEIGLNVVDLGLIYEINFSAEENTVVVVMTLTTEFCPMGDAITTDVSQTMAALFKEMRVNVDLIFDPPWSQKMISEEGRKFLQGY